MADPYGTNPLAEQMAERNPLRYAEVSAVKEPPKLFAGGTANTPAFTACGIDPQLLLKLPVGIRHAAATNPDIVQVLSWFEDFAHEPDAEIDTAGLRDAKLRVEDWLANTDLDTRTPAERAADDEAGYAEFYNPGNDRLAHGAEQKRRAKAGEEPLEDYDSIQRHKNAQRNAAAAQAEQTERPMNMSDADLRRLAEMVNGGA